MNLSDATSEGHSRPQVTVVLVDLNDETHGQAVREMLNHYACSEFGSGKPLDSAILDGLIPGLRASGNYVGYLAFVDGKAVGVANAFRGFSTFKAKPLVNVHDLCVHESSRGLGVGRQLLSRVVADAIEAGCCRVTLEVRSDNQVAKGLYGSLGFVADVPDGLSLEFLTRSIEAGHETEDVNDA